MVIEQAKKFSNTKLNELRKNLSELNCNEAIITFGSYARREASTQSDIDYIVVSDEKKLDEIQMNEIDGKISSIVPIEPSPTGAFAKNILQCSLLKNVGGENDTNENLTRRLLLLLEGEYLKNENKFSELRENLINLYVQATPKDHQLALFLLNDIIRYWRTMTVDYMYKTTEDTKPWGIRNIKLVFSRKLMYASGLFTVGLTVDRSLSEKQEILCKLFSMPAIDRIQEICGSQNAEPILKSYATFMSFINNEQHRDDLKRIDKGNHDDPTFRFIKNEGHNFTRALLNAFENVFHTTHPIHRAVIF